jgi:hypothetical protein
MPAKKRLYLDIDGVLLTVKQTKPADHSIAFIEFITGAFDCYWLTTHCKGDAKNAISYLTRYFNEQTLQLLHQVKPTSWETLKTEAIDFTHDFFWLEDYPFNSEKEVLIKNNRLASLVVVDLNTTDELRRIIDVLSNN